MAENTPPLEFVDGEPDGYCDPATGVCVVPGAEGAIVPPPMAVGGPEA